MHSASLIEILDATIRFYPESNILTTNIFQIRILWGSWFGPKKLNPFRTVLKKGKNKNSHLNNVGILTISKLKVKKDSDSICNCKLEWEGIKCGRMESNWK